MRIFKLFIVYLIPLVSYTQNKSVLKLDLQQCIEIALENNLQLKRSLLNYEIQKVGHIQSKLQQTPSLNIFSNYGNNWGRSVDPTTNTFLSTTSNFSGIGASSNITLFSGFSVRNSIKQSKSLLEKSVFDLENTKNNVMLSVVSQYLSIMLVMDRLENARYQYQSTREQLSRTIKLVEAGSIAVTNKLNLEAQLAGDELAVIQQENGYRLSILQLKQILLLENNEDISIERPVVELNPSTVVDSNPNEIYDVAISLLPEIKSAEKSAESSLYNLKISKGGRYPTISASSSFNSNYSSYANRQRDFYDGFSMQPTTIGYLTSNPLETVSSMSLVPNVVGSDKDFTVFEQWKDYLSKSLSFSISIPIFNRYTTSGNIKRAKLNKELSDINLIEAKNQVRQTIETSYNDALAASKSYSATVKQVRALEESFRIIQSQYDLGSINFTEYQISNNNLVRAKNDMLSSKYDYIFKLKVLDFYQGKELTF
jgi:outer membrane protein|tara:strand:- start:1383 stop:2831 length:1449 start_codon:yes stop_codon:yes gene_type:complete